MRKMKKRKRKGRKGEIGLDKRGEEDEEEVLLG